MNNCSRRDANSRKQDVRSGPRIGEFEYRRPPTGRNGPPLRRTFIERGVKPASVHLDRTQIGCGGPVNAFATIVTVRTTHELSRGTPVFTLGSAERGSETPDATRTVACCMVTRRAMFERDASVATVVLRTSGGGPLTERLCLRIHPTIRGMQSTSSTHSPSRKGAFEVFRKCCDFTWMSSRGRAILGLDTEIEVGVGGGMRWGRRIDGRSR